MEKSIIYNQPTCGDVTLNRWHLISPARVLPEVSGDQQIVPKSLVLMIAYDSMSKLVVGLPEVISPKQDI